MRDFGSTVLIATPSYALYMAEVAERMDALKDIRLRVGLFGAEASTEEMRAELERRYGILATENYGLTEVMGPGVSGECEYKCGMHINEDCFLAEIIDPDTGEVLPMGEQGELVLTTLAKEAQPAFATVRATLPASSRSPAPAAVPSFAWRRSRAAATTCSSSAG